MLERGLLERGVRTILQRAAPDAISIAGNERRAITSANDGRHQLRLRC